MAVLAETSLTIYPRPTSATRQACGGCGACTRVASQNGAAAVRGPAYIALVLTWVHVYVPEQAAGCEQDVIPPFCSLPKPNSQGLERPAHTQSHSVQASSCCTGSQDPSPSELAVAVRPAWQSQAWCEGASHRSCSCSCSGCGRALLKAPQGELHHEADQSASCSTEIAAVQSKASPAKVNAYEDGVEAQQEGWQVITTVQHAIIDYSKQHTHLAIAPKNRMLAAVGTLVGLACVARGTTMHLRGALCWQAHATATLERQFARSQRQARAQSSARIACWWPRGQ